MQTGNTVLEEIVFAFRIRISEKIRSHPILLLTYHHWRKWNGLTLLDSVVFVVLPLKSGYVLNIHKKENFEYRLFQYGISRTLGIILKKV